MASSHETAQNDSGETTVPSNQPSGEQILAHFYRGATDVKPETAKHQLLLLADEIISNLTNDPTADVKITLEIEARFPNGASDSTKRAVSENGNALGLHQNEWE